MDPNLTLEAKRLFISTALTTHAARSIRRVVSADSGEEGLLLLARRLGEEVGSVERRYRLCFEPLYPGVSAGVESVGSGFRLVLACTVFDNERTPFGVVFTTLIPNRIPRVSVAPIEARVPEDWRLPNELS
jgi:hypothetical protein